MFISNQNSAPCVFSWSLSVNSAKIKIFYEISMLSKKKKK